MTNVLGKLIRNLRKKQNLTMQQLANQIGVSESYISFIERGREEIPCSAVIHKLADVLDYDTKALLKLARDIKIARYVELMHERYK